VGLRPDQRGWKCFACHSSGSAVDFLSIHLFGEKLNRGDSRWGELLQELDDLGTGHGSTPRILTPTIPKTAVLNWPPREEVEKLWAGCLNVRTDSTAAQWLHKERGLNPIAIQSCTRVLTAHQTLPSFAAIGKRTWYCAGYRVIVPLFDHAGQLRSLRARRIVNPGAQPKSIAPRGFSIKGLFMANQAALNLFRHAPTDVLAPARIVVVEGEMDFLSWFQNCTDENLVLLGITAGSWTKDIGARIPSESDVYLRTHQDSAGDIYAERIANDLRQYCQIFRLNHGAQNER